MGGGGTGGTVITKEGGWGAEVLVTIGEGGGTGGTINIGGAGEEVPLVWGCGTGSCEREQV